MRKPRLTQNILNGLCFAFSHTEADDLSDFEEPAYGNLMRDFEAAGKWLTAMNEYREVLRQHKATKRGVSPLA